MSITLNIKKGLDISIVGKPEGDPNNAQFILPVSLALTPDDFPGLTLKPTVKEGDTVEAGDPILIDKKNPDLVITAPIAGTVKAIERGDRRKLLRVIIVPNPAGGKKEFEKGTKDKAEAVKKLLMSSGLWAMIKQRPYDIVADADTTPRDIYITTFDSAPLSGSAEKIYYSKKAELEAGVKALGTLTPGKVYVSRRANSGLADISGAEMVDITGPHPSGNAGVVIANTHPVNKGETVWTLDIATLYRIGHVLTTGKIDYNTTIALSGSEIEHPGYVSTIIGADVKSLLKGRLTNSECHKRIISGNVLSGISVGEDGYLHTPYRQLTVIPEGDDVTEFMGWASMSADKMSTSRSFPSHFLRKAFRPDARLLGGRRAMIMSGEYDKVLPMDIMTEYLVKAILSRNIEQMEALGIYEIAPEDVAVAEYVCTSKMPLQAIIREGLDYLRKELE